MVAGNRVMWLLASNIVDVLQQFHHTEVTFLMLLPANVIRYYPIEKVLLSVIYDYFPFKAMNENYHQ